MARLIFSVLASLDGYVADSSGGFDWAVPDEEVHAFINDQERPIGTYLYGRRLYEVMVAWEHVGEAPEVPNVVRDYARLWRAAQKVVYSTTLPGVSSANTRLEREFDPAAVRRLKESAVSDVSVGGPGLGARALAAGLVDEIRLILAPVVVGGGTRALPDGVHLGLELVDERRFDSGFVNLRYRTTV